MTKEIIVLFSIFFRFFVKQKFPVATFLGFRQFRYLAILSLKCN